MGGTVVSEPNMRIRRFRMPVDEPDLCIAVAEWADLPGTDRRMTSGSTLLIGDATSAFAAVAEAIERRSWWDAHSGEMPRDGWTARPIGDAADALGPRAHRERPQTSNGWACGMTPADAITAAAAEVLERHAYSQHHRKATASWRYPNILEGPTARSLRRFRLSAQILGLTPPDELFTVAMVVIADSTGGGPAGSIGLGWGLGISSAATHAVREALKVRVWTYRLHAAAEGPHEGAARRALWLATSEGGQWLADYIRDRVGEDTVAIPVDLDDSRPLDGVRPAVIDSARSRRIALEVVDVPPSSFVQSLPVAWVWAREAQFVTEIDGEQVPLV